MNTNLFRITVIAFVVGLYVSAAIVHAAETKTLLVLKDKCISATAINQATCDSYIQGVIGAYFATVTTLKKNEINLAFFCGPSSEASDLQGSEAYVRKYIMSYPCDDQRDAESVIFEALRELYGCKD
jgi:hypothetical protein